MKRIGLLSDTHSYLNPSIFKYFEECDEIWHAGDIGRLSLADELSAFKPFRAVYGNIDDHKVRTVYPEHLKFKCEEVNVWMTHIGGRPGYYGDLRPKLIADTPDLYITGHSHILRVQYDQKLGFMYMNPGAAGKHGFHKVMTILRFSINGKKIQDLEVIELGKREG